MLEAYHEVVFSDYMSVHHVGLATVGTIHDEMMKWILVRWCEFWFRDGHMTNYQNFTNPR